MMQPFLFNRAQIYVHQRLEQQKKDTGKVRAAVSVSGPITRTTKAPGAKYAEAVMHAARSIEASAGWYLRGDLQPVGPGRVPGRNGQNLRR